MEFSTQTKEMLIQNLLTREDVMTDKNIARYYPFKILTKMVKKSGAGTCINVACILRCIMYMYIYTKYGQSYISDCSQQLKLWTFKLI
jgi:hypothetical protein